jgi:hypothetical protein
MQREQFVRENPLLAAEQNREWNKWIARLVAIVSLWVASIFGTHEYFHNPEFQKTVDSFSERILQGIYNDMNKRF